MDFSVYGIGYPEINLISPIGNKNSRVNSRVFTFFLRMAGMMIVIPVCIEGW